MSITYRVTEKVTTDVEIELTDDRRAKLEEFGYDADENGLIQYFINHPDDLDRFLADATSGAPVTGISEQHVTVEDRDWELLDRTEKENRHA